MKYSVALSFAFVAALTASLSAADKETRQMMADIRILQEQTQDLANTVVALTTTLTEAIKSVNSRMDQSTEATRKSFADQKAAIDAATTDLRAIKERMDDNSVRLGQVTQEVDALRQAVVRIGAAGGGTASSPESGTVAPGSAPPSAPTGIAGGLSPSAAFHQAEGDYFAGQYDIAVMSLGQYIKDFPNSEDADNAQVLIGNSYINQAGKNQDAVDAYDLAIRNYPKGDKIPEAYYKKAMALSNLKRYDEARVAAEYVVKTYPDSGEASLAKQLLDRLPPPAPVKR